MTNLRTRKSIIVLFLLEGLLFGSTYGQTEDVSKYFDDGGASSAKNQIKTNISHYINGDFGISYQRQLAKRVFSRSSKSLNSLPFK
jgi:hypothetical protein